MTRIRGTARAGFGRFVTGRASSTIGCATSADTPVKVLRNAWAVLGHLGKPDGRHYAERYVRRTPSIADRDAGSRTALSSRRRVTGDAPCPMTVGRDDSALRRWRARATAPSARRGRRRRRSTTLRHRFGMTRRSPVPIWQRPRRFSSLRDSSPRSDARSSRLGRHAGSPAWPGFAMRVVLLLRRGHRSEDPGHEAEGQRWLHHIEGPRNDDGQIRAMEQPRGC